MGKLREMLDRMTIKIVSPDKSFEATLNSKAELNLTFFDDLYYEHDDESMRRQLLRVIPSLWEAFREGHALAMRRALGNDVSGQAEEPAEAKEMRRIKEEITIHGLSERSHVGIISTGMKTWEVDIEGGALEELSESEFEEELQSAYQALLSQYKEKVNEATRRIYGMNRV